MDILPYMAYPVQFTPWGDGGFTVVVSGVDGAISEGRTREAAEKAAIDVIADMANVYLDEKHPIPPAPAPKDGEVLVKLPIVMVIKIMLRNEMIAQNISVRALANRLGVSAQLLSQTLDLTRTRTSVDALAAAFRALGKTMKIEIS